MKTAATLLAGLLPAMLAPAETVVESARELPLAERVGVVVAGGSTGAVAAAVAAAGPRGALKADDDR